MALIAAAIGRANGLLAISRARAGAIGLFAVRDRAALTTCIFRERSAQLDVQARGLVAEAAKRANDEPGVPVEVIGYTDSAGSPPADFLLSKQAPRWWPTPWPPTGWPPAGWCGSAWPERRRAAGEPAGRNLDGGDDRGTRLTPRGRAGATKIGSERGKDALATGRRRPHGAPISPASDRYA